MVNSNVGLWWSTDLNITKQIIHTKFSYLGVLIFKKVKNNTKYSKSHLSKGCPRTVYKHIAY